MSRLSDFFEADKQGRRWNKKLRTNWGQEPDKEPEQKEKPIGKFLWWMYGDLSNKWTIWYITLEIFTVISMAMNVAHGKWYLLPVDAIFLLFWITRRLDSQRGK